MELSVHHQGVVDRFVAACNADRRVLAAFLGGSYAAGVADSFSDLDLYLVTSDADYAGFMAERELFLGQLGEPLLIEDFDLPGIWFVIFADGSEVEIGIGRQSQFDQIHRGPIQTLLDKAGILAGASLYGSTVAREEQLELLRRLATWFWHDMGHLITALGRGRLWWGQGQLAELRGYCLGLARLEQDFDDPGADGEVYFKLDRAVPPGRLARLAGTFCPMEATAMRQAAWDIVAYYQDVAPPLLATHGLAYPEKLARAMLRKLSELPPA